MEITDFKHSKGKWILGPKSRYDIVYPINCVKIGAVKLTIAATQVTNGVTKEEAEANATLIEAAPELLEVAILTMALLKNSGAEGSELFKKIEAVIEKLK